MSQPARTVIWIVSYPKSGNTWVRFLVCNLAFGPQSSAAALNRLAPDIHELTTLPDLPPQPVFFKTHFPCSAALPLASRTAGAIYVVRDPADVMLSNFHYARRSAAAAAEDPAALDQYLERYLTVRGDPHWVEAGMGTWDDHVRSWLMEGRPFPVLALRYEDLLVDALGGARRICAFLGLARSAAEIEEAVDGASFERLSEIEAADIRERKVGIFYKPYLERSIERGLRFMRAGKSGEAARVLTREQRRRLAAVFEATRRELGYGAS